MRILTCYVTPCIHILHSLGDFTPHNQVLFRSVTRSIQHLDSRNLLYAFMFCNIPAVNSLESIYSTLERPIMFGALKRIAKRLGAEKFPLIPQTYYPSHANMVISPEFPCVVKIGAFHSGYGKIKVSDRRVFDDVRSIVAMHHDYCTAERFIKWDYDIRVQKIGQHYRAFKRVSSNWKGNVGNESINEDMKMTDEFKLWIDECAKLFGGLDICALDAVHDVESDKLWILELNDTAIGLVHRHAHEDMQHIRDVVMMRLALAYPQLHGETSQIQQTVADPQAGSPSSIRSAKNDTKEANQNDVVQSQSELPTGDDIPFSARHNEDLELLVQQLQAQNTLLQRQVSADNESDENDSNKKCLVQ
jgi:synapsin